MTPGWYDTSPDNQVRLVVSWLVVAAIGFVCYVLLGLRGWWPPGITCVGWALWYGHLRAGQ